MAWTSNLNSTPLFVADWSTVARNTGRQIDWTRVPMAYRQGTKYTITASANASAAATSVSVAALPVALAVGTVLDFTGTAKLAILSAPALAGATSITVEALDAAITSGNTATHIVSNSRAKLIPAGTVMCELSGGKIVPRAVRPGSETATCLLETNADEGNRSDSLSGYGCIVGGVIFENLLPETITSYKSELAAAGSGFSWQTYADNR